MGSTVGYFCGGKSGTVVGSQLLGVVGAILSVPTAAIIQVLFQELITGDNA